MPISISASPRSNVGLPAAGTVHDVRAIPMLRAASSTWRAIPATSPRLRPSSAAAPAIFSSSTVAPTPRRPAVNRLSCTATSSSTTTASTCDAGVGGQLCRHLEVHHVAGVVLHDVQDARAAVDGGRRRQHLVGHRGGEHLAGTGRVEHAEADEPAVQRLVARAAAGDEADLAAGRAQSPR